MTNLTPNQKRHVTTDIIVQRKLKNGKWGANFRTSRIGSETPEQAIERLERLNGIEYRLVSVLKK